MEPELEGAARRNVEIPNKSPNSSHKKKRKRGNSQLRVRKLAQESLMPASFSLEVG